MVTDKMALAERNSDKAGVISIHSEEFELILHIDGMFTAVAASPDDCLFAFDRVNHSVKKYSIKGICLQSFKTNSKMVLGMYAQDDRYTYQLQKLFCLSAFYNWTDPSRVQEEGEGKRRISESARNSS